MENTGHISTPLPGGSKSNSSLNTQFSMLATKSHSDVNLAMASESNQTIVGQEISPSDYHEFLAYKAQKMSKQVNENGKRSRENSGGNTSGTPSKKGRPNIPAEFLPLYRAARNSRSNEARFTVLDLYLRKYLNYEEHLIPKAYQVINYYHPKITFSNTFSTTVPFLDQIIGPVQCLEHDSDMDMDQGSN